MANKTKESKADVPSQAAIVGLMLCMVGCGVIWGAQLADKDDDR